LDSLAILTDVAVLEELGSRVTAARLRRNLTQVALAREAGVSRNTVERLERGVSIDLKLLVRMLRALSLLDAFLAGIPADEPSPMALLEARGHKRQRARRAPAGLSARKVTP
jgi:transcriptional regulator with XRE-family HTH domain